MYDLIIVGGGPAGVSAGVYAARKRLKTLLIAESFGGQSMESAGIENWIGVKNVSGKDFARMLEEHLQAVASQSVEIALSERVAKVEKEENGFEVKTEEGKQYKAKTVLVATGSTRRKLDIQGAKEFEGKGLTYCASCDGPVFAGQAVAVIGGGNAGFETAAQLLAYATTVTLLNRSDSFKADETTVNKVLAHPNMTAIKNAIPKEIRGNKFVDTMIYHSDDGEHELKVSGIFVEIGLIPATKFVEGLVELNSLGQIKIDHKTGRASLEGIWAAGDSSDGLYHQNNIAAGDAVKALEDIYLYLHAR